jgi:hypothetical protein
MAKGDKAAKAANDEQLARTDNFRPTPTQEENDRAKLGFASLKELDDKEPDGSEEQPTAPASAPKSADKPSDDK